MTLLDRYLAVRIVTTLLKTLLALIFLFVLIDFLTQRQGDISKNDVPWGVVGLYYLSWIPTVIYQYQGAALAMLISSLLVFGAAARNNEITAALSGGISLWRLVRAPVAMAALLAVGVFLMQENLGTLASSELDDINSHYFSRSSISKRPGISWAHLTDDWTCHIMKFNRRALSGEGVFMHSFREDAVEQIQANRIFWDETTSQWMLEDGRWFMFYPKKDWDYEVPRITQCPAPIHETPDELFALEQSPNTKTVAELHRDIGRAKAHGMPTASPLTDLYAKFSQPALSFIMIWLAIPFAMRLRRGGLAIGFGVSIAIGLAYLMLYRVGMGLGHIGRLSPFIAAWLANITFMIFGLYLVRKTPT